MTNNLYSLQPEESKWIYIRVNTNRWISKIWGYDHSFIPLQYHDIYMDTIYYESGTVKYLEERCSIGGR